MAVTPTEAREFTHGESMFLHGLEIKIDTFIKATGLGSGETKITYPIEAQDRSNLNSKAQSELTKRYNNAGWNSSFTMAGPNPKEFVLMDPKG